MNLFVLYLIVFLIPIGLVSAYILLKKFNKLSDKIAQIIFYIIAGLSLALALVCAFVITGAMIPYNGDGVPFEGGCISLNGVPYGDKSVLNFFAWLILFSF